VGDAAVRELGYRDLNGCRLYEREHRHSQACASGPPTGSREKKQQATRGAECDECNSDTWNKIDTSGNNLDYQYRKQQQQSQNGRERSQEWLREPSSHMGYSGRTPLAMKTDGSPDTYSKLLSAISYSTVKWGFQATSQRNWSGSSKYPE
jgi:hypothetical protein